MRAVRAIDFTEVLGEERLFAAGFINQNDTDYRDRKQRAPFAGNNW